MTTIALDKGTVAADSQCTSGDFKSKCTKLVVVKTPTGKVAVALTGSIACMAPVCACVAAGESPKAILPDDTSILVVGRSWAFWLNDEESWAVRDWDAGGSGRQVALYLLSHGKGAVRAVEGAAEVDLYTGGPVVSVKRTGLSKRVPAWLT